VKLENDEVSSRWRDYRDKNKVKIYTRSLQRTATDMMIARAEMINLGSACPLENSLVFRNGILLLKGPFFCIVVYERGLRSRPVSPLFSRINRLTPSKIVVAALALN